MSPEGGGTLLTSYLYSGHGINELGDFDSCNKQSELEYVLIRVLVNKSPVVSMGICGPKSCSKGSNYDGITQAINELIKSNPDMKDADIEAIHTIPAEVNEVDYVPEFWLMITAFIIIWILWVMGMIVQYTSLGNKADYDSEERENTRVEDRKNRFALFFYAWSPIANLEKLFTVKPNADQTLTVLNGVRVLSICWVIVGHGFGFIFFAPVANITTVEQMTSDKLFAIIPGGFYAVDSFFFLSGFLSFYLLSIKLYRKGGILSWPLIYFHRYYRLIFPVLFVTGIAMYNMKYLGDGPVYKQNIDLINISCKKYSWTNFLFINNLYPWVMGEECIGWVWYLANDFQFFLMTPPLIFLYSKNRYIGYISTFLLVVVSMIVNGVITAERGYSVTLGGGDQKGMDILYSKPWGRMGPYFVGGLFGFAFFEYANCEKYPQFMYTIPTGIFNKLKESKLISVIFLLVGFSLTALFVFPLRSYYVECGAFGDNCWSKTPSVIYNAACRPLFVLGLGLCVVPCFVGRLRIVKGLLGNEVMAVLARLNYMVYMNHCLILIWLISDLRQASYVNYLNQWYFSIGAMVFSFLFAIPMTLMFEVPFMNIEKNVLFPASKKPQNGHANRAPKGPKYEAFVEEKDTLDTQNDSEKLLK